MICNFYKNDKLSKNVCFICDNEYNYFLNKKNVVGIGLGYKIKRGFYTKEKCIKVFVSKKLSLNKVKSKDIIPNLYKEIKTDVVESGIFKIKKLDKKIRPVLGGYSIGPSIISSGGTLGCLVTDGNDNYILGNNHVLARNKFQINTPIVQPSIKDGGIIEKDVIAILSKYISVQFINSFLDKSNYVDCAIAKVINKSLVSSKIALLGNIEHSIIPKLGIRVCKVGKTTELTYGTITNINCTLEIEFQESKIANFKNQIISDTLVKKGDSGAMLLDDKNNVLGMLMSGTENMSVYNPINLILDALKVRIVSSFN